MPFSKLVSDMHLIEKTHSSTLQQVEMLLHQLPQEKHLSKC